MTFKRFAVECLFEEPDKMLKSEKTWSAFWVLSVLQLRTGWHTVEAETFFNLVFYFCSTSKVRFVCWQALTLCNNSFFIIDNSGTKEPLQCYSSFVLHLCYCLSSCVPSAVFLDWLHFSWIQYCQRLLKFSIWLLILFYISFMSWFLTWHLTVQFIVDFFWPHNYTQVETFVTKAKKEVLSIKIRLLLKDKINSCLINCFIADLYFWILII